VLCHRWPEAHCFHGVCFRTSDNCALLLSFKMHLMYTLDASGKRLYTLQVSIHPAVDMTLINLNHIQKTTADGKVTKSAHPGTCRFAISLSRS
jgi:hypothetical protein